MTFTATQVLNDAMLVGGIDSVLDDDPVNHAYAVLFDGAAVPLVTMVFTKPAATLVDHTLVFGQEDASGDFILTQGNAASFQLYSGTNTLLLSGDVSDEAGTGALKVKGTAGTLLYAGARAILGELKFV